MVFCACGASLRVPFSSTALPDVPDAPETKPMRFPSSAPDESALPMPQSARPVAVPVEDSSTAVPVSPPEDPLPRSPSQCRRRKVDPAFCWHHERTPSAGWCSACKMPFCADCLVTLGANSVCGPCKDYRVAQVGLATRTLPLARAALAGSLVAAVLALVLSLIGVILSGHQGSVGGVMLILLALLFPAGAMAASVWAMLRVASQPRLGGRALATSGLCVSMVALAWTVGMLLVAAGHYVAG